MFSYNVKDWKKQQTQKQKQRYKFIIFTFTAHNASVGYLYTLNYMYRINQKSINLLYSYVNVAKLKITLVNDNKDLSFIIL